MPDSSLHCEQTNNVSETSIDQGRLYSSQNGESNAAEVSEETYINYTLCCTSRIHKAPKGSNKGRNYNVFLPLLLSIPTFRHIPLYPLYSL